MVLVESAEPESACFSLPLQPLSKSVKKNKAAGISVNFFFITMSICNKNRKRNSGKAICLSCKRFFILNGKYLMLLLVVSSVFLFSCKKKDTQNSIPNVSVDITIQLALPQYSSLTGIGNSITISGGVKGIIVYRKSQDEFQTYERSCPYDPLVNAAIIKVDSSGVLGVDYNCGSKFLLLDGSIVNGPSTRQLKAYTIA